MPPQGPRCLGSRTRPGSRAARPSHRHRPDRHFLTGHPGLDTPGRCAAGGGPSWDRRGHTGGQRHGPHIPESELTVRSNAEPSERDVCARQDGTRNRIHYRGDLGEAIKQLFIAVACEFRMVERRLVHPETEQARRRSDTRSGNVFRLARLVRAWHASRDPPTRCRKTRCSGAATALQGTRHNMAH